jgi:hypothetical protein
MNASSLVSYIDPCNVSSMRLPKRLGAAYEGAIELAIHGPHCVFRFFPGFLAFSWRSAKQTLANLALGSRMFAEVLRLLGHCIKVAIDSHGGSDDDPRFSA